MTFLHPDLPVRMENYGSVTKQSATATPLIPPPRLSAARNNPGVVGGGGDGDRDAGSACLDKWRKSVAVEGRLEVTRFTEALEGPRRRAGPCEPGGD